jgi:hypothetical protein
MCHVVTRNAAHTEASHHGVNLPIAAVTNAADDAATHSPNETFGTLNVSPRHSHSATAKSTAHNNQSGSPHFELAGGDSGARSLNQPRTSSTMAQPGKTAHCSRTAAHAPLWRIERTPNRLVVGRLHEGILGAPKRDAVIEPTCVLSAAAAVFSGRLPLRTAPVFIKQIKRGIRLLAKVSTAP